MIALLRDALVVLSVALVCVAAVSLVWNCLKRLVLQALREDRRRGWGLPQATLRLIAAGLGVLGLGILVAWMLTGRPVFGLLALIALPAILARVLPWLRARRAAGLDDSALSYL